MERLFALRDAMADLAGADSRPGEIARLALISVDGWIHVDFYGDPFEEYYEELMTLLADREIAGLVASIQLRGPDEGSNGTRNWNLNALADSPTPFSSLRYLSIEQGRPGDHNETIVAETYEEGGVLARILSRSPVLETLITPSAPNEDFFRLDLCALQNLNVDSGYAHENFIANLAGSSGFPQLNSLEFGEYRQTYRDDFADQVTPFEDYRYLFKSPAFDSIRLFRWKNPVCTAEQIKELCALRPGCQFQVVRWSAEWIR